MMVIVRTAGGYLAAVAACLVILTLTMHLGRADPRVPLNYDGDALWNLMWVKGLAENGSYLRNDRIGAPYGMDLRDFPMADGLHFALLALLVRALGDPALALNAYYLLTFPLITVTALAVLRQLRVPYGPAVVAALLYAFMPYHFFRGEMHIFLAAYYLLPPLILVMLWLYLDAGMVFRRDEGGAVRWALTGRRTQLAVAVCLLTGVAGVYYAFFGCYFLLVAGLACAARVRRAYPLAAAGLLVALVGLAVAANTAPSWDYHLRHGSNPEVGRRSVFQAEFYGLQLGQMLAPVHGHRIGQLGVWADRFNSEISPLCTENRFASLGLVGCAGLLVLLGRLVCRYSAAQPRAKVQDGLTLFTLAALLLALAGGAGVVFNFAVSTGIRCYNRIGIFIAFFALTAVALLLGKLANRATAPAARWGSVVLLALLLLAGVYDQVPREFVPDYARLKCDYQADAAFVERVEAALPEGGMVFQLPYLVFPEGVGAHRMATSYELLRPYLHSHSLRWSFGAVQGRYAATWQERVAGMPVPEMLDTLACAGFVGIMLDRAGLGDGDKLEPQLRELLGTNPLEGGGGRRLAFYDLRGHADRLRARLSATEWASRRESVLMPVLVTWQDGFTHQGRNGPHREHFGARRATLTLHNPAARPRTVCVTMSLTVWQPEPAEVRVEGAVWSGAWEVGPEFRTVSQTLTLPPGEHRVTFHCAARPVRHLGDTADRTVVVRDFTVQEVE